MNLKRFLFVDFESYYDRDECTLKKLSVPEYIFHPKFEVLMLAAFDTEWPAPRIILPHDIPAFLAQYPASETICCSHNALFDMAILAWRYTWVAGLMQDTLGMVRALRNYQRNSLGAVIKELFGRDSKGDTIHKVQGMHAQDIKNVGLWPAFCEYALNDVRECYHIYCKLYPELPAEERQVMDLVLRAAVVPRLHADVPLLELHLEDLRRRKDTLLRESGYDKAALMSAQSFKDALESLGVDVVTKISPTGRSIPAFAKSDPFMADLLEYNGSPDDDLNYRVQTLAAARLSQKSTIEETRAQRFLNIAKLQWTETVGNGQKPVSDLKLLPVALRYGGAHTHRLCLAGYMPIVILRADVVKTVRLDQLRNDDLIWDGETFVSHGGLVFAGLKETIEYDGIIGTPDHRVWTVEHGYCGLAEAKARGHHIAYGDIPDPTRIDPSVYRSDSIQNQDPLFLQHMRADDAVQLVESTEPRRNTLQGVSQTAANLGIARLELCPSDGSVGTTTLYDQEKRQLQELRSARDRISFFVGQSHGGMGFGESWAETEGKIHRSDRQQRPLRTRQSTLGNTSGAKYQQTWDIVDCGPRNRFMANGRIVHNSGEWKMNMQNLPRDKTKSKLRAALKAPPGDRFIAGDLAQIEARIVAKLAGEAGLVEAFRRGDDVYAKFAGVIFGRTITNKANPNERFIGKTAILGLGYGCGPDRFHNMVVTQARQYGIPLEGLFDVSIAETTVRTYRSLFSRIQGAWHQLDRLLANVINNPNNQFARWPDPDTGPLTFKTGTIILPNKMTLRYIHDDPKLYGAKIFENIVQALARIVVMQAAVRLSRRGYNFALQSHDELLFAVPENIVADVRVIISEEMTREPKWLPGLPLAVEIGEGNNYGEVKK